MTSLLPQLLLGLGAMIIYSIALSFLIKIYAGRFGHAISLGTAYLFQIACSFFDFLIFLVFLLGGIFVVIAGPSLGALRGMMVFNTILLTALSMVGSYFWLAKRLLKIEKLPALGLFGISMITGVLVNIVVEFLGVLMGIGSIG